MVFLQFHSAGDRVFTVPEIAAKEERGVLWYASDD